MVNDLLIDRSRVLEVYPDAVSHNAFGTAWWVEGDFKNLSGYHRSEDDAWLVAANRIDQANPDSFRGHMALACRTVAKWPEWKQNVLGSSGESTGPRRESIGGTDVY